MTAPDSRAPLGPAPAPDTLAAEATAAAVPVAAAGAPVGEAAALQAAAPQADHSRVLRNASLLVIAQLAITPLNILVTAVMARYVGAAEYGRLYLAATMCSFGFMAVDWGQTFTLPGMVARDRANAGQFLATGLLWRAVMAVFVSVLLAAGSVVLGYDGQFLVILGFSLLGATVGTFSSACAETVRGFERMDVMAYTQVGGQLLSVFATIVTLLLGGSLALVLAVQAGCSAIVLAFVSRVLRPVGVGKLVVSRSTLREFAVGGVPFVVFAVTMALQPIIDAVFLSKLAPVEVVGWHAVSRRLVGFLLLPATAILAALYPTLCRLHVEDKARYARTTGDAIRTTTMLAVPMALSCFLYPDIGIRIYSRDSFGPAEDNLRIMSVFLFLLYFSMPLGCSLLAGGRQRAWSFAQLAAAVASTIMIQFTIPWFQARTGNGGLGICVSGVISEVLMVGAGIWLAPKGIFHPTLFRKIGLSLAAGAAMFVTARLLAPFSSFIGAPIALAVYGTTLYLIGGIDPEQVEAVKAKFAGKFAKLRAR
ncbi:MAG TPA: oligosaccharide flippase family protein [Polyangiaceae bacterium]